MPYKSEAQRKFFNSPVGKKKLGKEEVEKWNEESEGQKNLPEHVKNIDRAIKLLDSFDTKEGMYKGHSYKVKNVGNGQYEIYIDGKNVETPKLRSIDQAERYAIILINKRK